MDTELYANCRTYTDGDDHRVVIRRHLSASPDRGGTGG